LWVTAQVGSDPLTGSLVPVAGGSEAQLRQAISNLQKILAAARMTPAEVVHARVQYVDQHDRAALAAIIAEQDMPQGVATLSQVPFIPTAQSGVTVKVDAVARAAAD